MKISINGRFLTHPISGVERYSIEIVKAWDNMIRDGTISNDRYEFEILAPRRKIKYDLNLKNIPVKQLGNFSGHVWEQFELPFYVRGDILFCPGNTIPLLSSIVNYRKVLTVHSLSYKYFSKAYDWKFRALYNYLIPIGMKISDTIITVSDSERRQIASKYTWVSQKLIMIQNGGPSQRIFSKKKSTKGNKFQILFVGSLSKAKNIHGVLTAFKILNRTDVKLIIVGESSKSLRNEYFDLIFENERNIDFKGYINDYNDLFELYQSSDLFIFPSFYEASPFPPIEAMSAGCPVLVSAIPALIERCGDAAMYCDPGKPADIANKILKIIKNKKLRNTLSKKGLEWSQHYSWESCAKKTLMAIENCISKNILK